MKKAFVILMLLLASTSTAQNKVVVIPLTESGSNAAAGSEGQFQYNDNGILAGAEIYYRQWVPGTQRTHFNTHTRFQEDVQIKRGDYTAGISIQPPEDLSSPVDLYFFTGLSGTRTIRFWSDKTELTKPLISTAVGIGVNPPQATLDVNGYAKLKPYNSAPTACNVSSRGTIVMNDEYELCVCRPAVLGSAFKLVRDINFNCW